MKKLVLILFFVSLKSQAFTLTDNRFFRYGHPEEIKVYAASDGCASAGGYTASEMLDMAVNGAKLYWNTVETANVRFVKGGVISTLSANGKDLSTFYTNVVANEINAVYVGCSSAVPATAAAYATVRGSDKSIRGMVLYKDSATNFSRSYDTTSAILAHEMGHTLGLGHSRFTTALMDSSGGPLGLNKLTQDDRDGVTYLYPHEKSVGGCLGSMGTLKFVDDDDDLPPRDIDINPQGVLSFIIGVLLALGLYHKVTLGKKSRGNCIEI